MPYIVTTQKPGYITNQPSRRAVATLEEAREEIRSYCKAPKRRWPLDRKWTDALVDAHHIPESGGAVGPLPDGTVIEVERVEWRTLVAGDPAYVTHSDAEIIDAYNARQEAS